MVETPIDIQNSNSYVILLQEMQYVLEKGDIHLEHGSGKLILWFAFILFCQTTQGQDIYFRVSIRV